MCVVFPTSQGQSEIEYMYLFIHASYRFEVGPLVVKVVTYVCCILMRCKGCSKGAPVPIPRHACSQTLWYAGILLSKDTANAADTAACTANCGCRRCVLIVGALAVGTARACDLPSQVICKAVFTSTNFGTFRVVVRIFVERDSMARVSVTEDVAASSTVMLSREEAEVDLAGCVVANNGFRIRLQEK